MTGLLLDGRLVDVDGLSILSPASHGGPAWCALSPGDYRMRPPGMWIRQIIVHTTKGDWPQTIVPGAGAGVGGRAKVVADFWRDDPVHSAAQLVVDTDGTVACLGDLVRDEAYHAEGSNPWSVGIELYQEAAGVLRQATIEAGARLALALCELLAIPPQIHARPYGGASLERMERTDRAGRHQLGGPDVVGILGHRDNTSRRGRGDPGDAIVAELVALGAEALDFAIDEDLAAGKRRQMVLNARGERLTVDGIVGPASIAAARRHGFKRWRDVG